MGGLGRRAEEGADLLPGHADAGGVDHRVDDLLFAAGAGDDGALEEAFLDRNLVGVIRIEVFEALGKFVGVIEDVLDRTWHSGHLINFARAGMAWMISPQNREAFSTIRSGHISRHRPVLDSRGFEGVVSGRLVTFWSQKIQHRAKLGNIGQHRTGANMASERVFCGLGNTSQHVP